MSTRYDPRMHAYDEQSRHAGMIYLLMLVVALAFGGFVWQLYSAPDIPRISAPAGPYKVAPPSELNEPDPREAALTEPEVENAPTGTIAPAEEEAPPVAGPPQLTPAPAFASSGRFVAQLAALQSEAGVEAAWRRYASRAPDLFARARMDVERADLGQRGVYYRIRAGYFADRDNAARFCERIRQMGQDCIVAAR
ncbi:MAG TPA: SPOR domain-containing protein [Candidatus Binatia bacterium]|nr:SPOR domain-containing protein [Candidatus Binatia bacterium]